MAVSRRGLALLGGLPLVCALGLLSDARADPTPGMCRVVDIDFTPGGFPATSQDPEIVPQIVAWLERADGAVFDDDHQRVKTMYITNQTGRFGLGNRPGRFDFNSGPNWPYGRRVTVFPVWANRHGLTFPQVVYQNGEDFNLSHPAGDSSPEAHFCRPLMQTESNWDAASCPSAVYTDKGVFGPAATALYPPRIDVIPSLKPQGQDSSSVAEYKKTNPFDAVSQASPRLGAETTVSWPMPFDLPKGEYVVFVEVALERDFNATFSARRYPSPTKEEIPWSEYGVAYRGQPSVVYSVPVTIGSVETVATTDTYAGYGDPGPDPALDGLTPTYFAPAGTLNPPDPVMITSDQPNTGAGRLLLTSKGGQLFRVRVDARPEPDLIAPAAPGAMAVVDTQAGGATLSFIAPGNDGTVGTVAGYDVRYRVGDAPITSADFDTANEAMYTGEVVTAGQLQTLVVANLLPETQYSFAVRAFDNCRNTSSLTTVAFTTAPRKLGEVDACFIATAAYGSLLANDVEMLRRFRDRMLRRSVLGELAVETYYTFGPAVAGLIGESDLLRSTARDALAPLVRWVRAVH